MDELSRVVGNVFVMAVGWGVGLLCCLTIDNPTVGARQKGGWLQRQGKGGRGFVQSRQSLTEEHGRLRARVVASGSKSVARLIMGMVV